MKTRFSLVLILSAMMLGAGCKSVEKMLDEGRYDELLSLAERRLSGKKVNKEKYVLAAEEAFRKVTEKDMARIDRLKQSDRSSDWQEIVNIASRIERRQDKLSPFLPLVSENGYQAKFNFVKVHEIIAYAEAEIIEALYTESLSHLSIGRNGDKHAAQLAYDKLDEIISRRGEYRDAYTLRDEARELGIVHVQMLVDNKMSRHMPGDVADALDESISGMQSTFWIRYYNRLPEEIHPDLIVRLVINGVDVSPESISREEARKQRQIEDGWQYVLDANGNVAKDSLGNDIKVKKFRDVSAVVIRTHQEKGAYLRAELEVVDAFRNHILESRPLQVESRFYHQAQSFFGDERALDKKERVQIGMLPFPSDASMLLTVAELMRPAFFKELEKSQYL